MKVRGSNYGSAIFELKVTKKRGKLEEMCDKALEQIEDRNYVSELEEDGYKDVICYGISFYEKECMVKTM